MKKIQNAMIEKNQEPSPLVLIRNVKQWPSSLSAPPDSKLMYFYFKEGMDGALTVT